MALLFSLPQIYRKDIFTNLIAGPIGGQLDQAAWAMEEIRGQLFLDSATWGLQIFERELNLRNTAGKTLEERRSIIRAKWRGAGSLTLETIKQTIAAFTNGIATVTFTGVIEIDFSGKIGYPPNLEDVYQAIEDIKPAHIGVKYIFRFRTHGEVSKYRHNELQPYTHGSLYKKDLPTFLIL